MTSFIFKKLASLGIKPFGETFKPFSSEAIARIEQTIGAQLPENYKDFLLKYGSSTFSTEVNCTPSKDSLYFGYFYDFDELVTAIDGLQETLPKTIIPFGDDSGDIVFCIGISGGDYGKVYIHNNSFGWHADAEKYLERGEPVPSDIRYQTVEEIAPSFEEFINNMQKEGDGN